nr:MAG TPA: hypothetical protein [Caudoviricetes sp.]
MSALFLHDSALSVLSHEKCTKVPAHSILYGFCTKIVRFLYVDNQIDMIF